MRIISALLLILVFPAMSIAAGDNRVAVFDIDIQNAEKAISRPLTVNIRNELSKSGKYEVIDKTKMDINFATKNFNPSACVSGQCMVDAGQFLGAGKIITGSLNITGGMFHLTLSLVNTVNGKIERVLSDKCQPVSDELVDLSGKLARKLMDIGVQEPSAAAGPSSGKTTGFADNTYKDPFTDMEFVFVKGGCYRMGDGFGDGDGSERPVHEVCVNDFWIGKFEVTQGQWSAIMGTNPSFHKNCGDNCPVENINWNDAQEFAVRLAQKTSKAYRLPTEAEWEYAARSGGKKEKWAGTSSEPELGEYAWFHKNSEKKTHPAGQKKANSLGLYDMSGNVWEWTSDRYKEKYYSESPRDNPNGPEIGRSRVNRGGSCSGFAGYLRTTDRGSNEPSYRSSGGGFRCLMTE